jgi:plastocyanin
MALACLGALVMMAAIACDDEDSGGEGTPAAAATPAASGEAGVTAEAASPIAETVTYAPDGPVTFSVLSGSTEGNRDVEAFMPADITIRAGDSIEWTSHGFEGHTITFGANPDNILFEIGDYLVPDPANPSQVIFNPKLALASERQGTVDGDGAYINSGFFGVPAAATYKLTFTKEGLYQYLCLVHPFTMTGTVTVEPESTQVVSPETITSRAEAERDRYLEELQEEARRVDAASRSAPGPGDSTIHYVQVGAITDHGQVAVYLPGALDIKAGDTVIFQNDDRNFHNVIFKGDREELPAGIGIVPDPDGRGLNFSLDPASAVAVNPPAGGFDETTFLSSGSMGVLQPRLNWTLKFDTPGTYVYACTIHVLAGMSGVINVQ